MIFHRLKKIKKGKKFEFKIDLVERHFFSEKKISEVMTGIKKEDEAKALVEVLENGFKNGVKAAGLKLGQDIKL